MTKLLTEVMRKVAELPEDRQEDAAHVLLAMLENDASSCRLTDDQLCYVERAIADVDAGRFASDDEVAAILNRPWA
jgi:predicted transcriptional regulator